MPPKVKTTREEIINTAFEIARQSGEQFLNARTIAKALNCSTQPVFSNFTSMNELRLAVVEKADALCKECMKREVESGKFPPYKAHGMAYIRFAKEEKELFKLLYMRDRTEELSQKEAERDEQMESLIRKNIGISGNAVSLFHLENWAYVHGIATMFATGYFDIEWELVSKMLTDCYLGLKAQYEKGE